MADVKLNTIKNNQQRFQMSNPSTSKSRSVSPPLPPPPPPVAPLSPNLSNPNVVYQNVLYIALNPIVIMNITEHWTKISTKDGSAKLVVGGLIGKQKGRNVEIMNSFELKTLMIPDTGGVIIDRHFFLQKETLIKKTYPEFNLVGWYTTGDSPTDSDVQIHRQIAQIAEIPVLLKFNPLNRSSRLPISTYESILDFVNGEQTYIFEEIAYTLMTEEKNEPIARILNISPSQNQSNYDTSSIYDPINTRPSSQMSNRSTFSSASGISSLYSANSYYANRLRNNNSSNSNNHSHSSPLAETEQNLNLSKEQEVDHLTDLLVQSMENSGDPDFFGMCYKCGKKVLGEGSGCTAMDQVYHIKCFTCHVCLKELRGLTFYSMDGKPYCKEDYLNTLEKCCVCNQVILDRILRATGKPYHPNCFRCVVCDKCLDGIEFTVDNTNQIHCIEDFNKRFAPRCCVCLKPIMPEPNQQETVRIVALDRSFHIGCYKCEDCGLLLTSDAEDRGCYPLDGHILCRHCNAKRVQQLSCY